MRRGLGPARLAAAIVLTAGVAAALPAPVLGFDLTGCQLTVTSANASGGAVGAASGPGAGGTLSDPFMVDPEGSVRYDGSTDSVIRNHTWHVDVYGIPILTGGHDNSGGSTTGNGDVDVSTYALDRLAGLYHVSGGISGEGGSCSGSGWVKLTNDPVGTLPWIAGLVLAALGLATLAAATPTWRQSVVSRPVTPDGRP